MLEDFAVDIARVQKSTVKVSEEEIEKVKNQKLMLSFLRRNAKQAVVDEQKTQRQVIRDMVEALRL